jgi:hypothetical protein
MDVSIVKVDDENADLLAHLIKELANFEHLEPPSTEVISRLKRDLSSKNQFSLPI